MPATRFAPFFDFAATTEPRDRIENCENWDDSIAGDRSTLSSKSPPPPLATLQVHPATEYEEWQPDGCETKTKTAASRKSSDWDISEDEMRFLKTVIDNPEKPSSAYAKLVGMYAQKAISVRRRLVKTGYLQEERINVNKRGRASIMLIPTEKAYRLFADESGEAS